MKKKPIILVGGGGHCISSIDVVESAGLYEIVGILDLPERIGQQVLNYPIIGTDDQIDSFVGDCPNYLITVGQISSSILREKIYQRVTRSGGVLPFVVSPFSYVSKYAKINEATIIMHDAFVNAGAVIGRGCIINTKAMIEHEAVIGDFSHVSTASVINGQVNIGERCFIGSNTVVSNNVNVVRETVIAAGSKVYKDIKLSGTYIGQPLRKIR